MRRRGAALAWVLVAAACGGEDAASDGALESASAASATDADDKGTTARARIRSEDEAAAPSNEAAKPSRTPAEWARILRDENSSDDARNEAVDALVKLGADAVPFLVDALADDASENFALEGLRLLGPRGVAAAPALFDRIRRGKMSTDCFVLAEFGPAVIPAMERALTDESEDVRSIAATVLETVAMRGARNLDAAAMARLGEIFGRMAGDEEPAMRGVALRALGFIWQARSDTGTLLVSGLSDEHWYIRCYAATSMGRCPGDASAILPALVRALDDPNVGVGYAAAASLRALGDRAGDARVAVLEFLRKHPQWNVAGAAEVGVEPLQVALASGDPAMRRLAAETLAEMGARATGAAPALTKALDDPLPEVRANALDALAAAGPGADAGPKLRAAFAAPEANVRAAAARALGRLPAAGEDVIGDLLKGLSDPVGDVRAESAVALGRLASDAARCVPALVVLLDDRDLRARASAAQAIGAFGAGARDALPDLRRALANEDPWTRLGAAMSVAQVQHSAEEPWAAFAKLVVDSNRDVRMRAVSLLRDLRRSEGVPLLVGRLDDRDRQVRYAAAEALGAMGATAADAVAPLEHMTTVRDTQLANAARDALAAIRGK